MRGDELPEELSAIGAKALDVGAYRAWPVWHPFVAAAWTELGVETGCYDDIVFRTGDCTSEVLRATQAVDSNTVMDTTKTEKCNRK